MAVTFKPFTGFKPEVVDFLTNLKENNNKEWFTENKEFYEKELKAVSQDLVNEMKQRFAALNLPYFADIRKSLFRIYRDVRFSANKDPYKTNLGVYFLYHPNYDKYKDLSMGLYLHIAPEELFIAAGIHMPDPKSLRLFRQRLAEDFETFEDLLKSKEFKKEFPKFYPGETLKKAPAGFSVDHPAIEYLRMKEFTVYETIKVNDITSAKLCDTLLHKGQIALPYMEYFFEAKEIDD